MKNVFTALGVLAFLGGSYLYFLWEEKNQEPQEPVTRTLAGADGPAAPVEPGGSIGPYPDYNGVDNLNCDDIPYAVLIADDYDPFHFDAPDDAEAPDDIRCEQNLWLTGT